MEKYNKVKNTASGIATGLVFKIMGIILPFIIRTIIIKKLGSEYLGLTSLFSSILQALNLAELGLGSSMVFSLYKPIAEKDTKKLSSLYNFYKTLYRVIGIGVLLIGGCLSFFVPYLIEGDVPSDINIYIIYFVYLGNTVLSYLLFAYKNSLLQAYQRTDIENIIGIFTNLILYGTQIILLLFFKNFYIYLIVLPVSTVVSNFIRAIVVDKKFPEIRPSGKIDSIEKMKIGSNMAAMLGHQISFTVINSADNIIISALLGLTVVAEYNNYYYILNALNALLVVIFQSAQAGIGNSIITENKFKVKSDFLKFSLAVCIVVSWSTICMYSLTQNFMEIWVGKEYMLDSALVIFLTLAFFITQIRKTVTTYKNAAGYWKKDFIKPYIVILVDILIDFLLIPHIGVAGALIATVVSMGFVSIPWETFVLFKHLFNEKPFKYLGYLLVQLVLTALGCFLGEMFVNLIPIGHIYGFLIKLIAVSIFSLVFVLVINIYNKNLKWLISRFFSLIKNKR